MLIVDKIKCFGSQLWTRFEADTPKIARRIRNVCAFISGLALAVMTALLAAQSQIPGWFNDIYPYCIGVPAAIAFLCQFAEDKKIPEGTDDPCLPRKPHQKGGKHE